MTIFKQDNGMSNSLGTLMFGADIDLTQLKQKIQSGNQDILNALKMNYDPKSYTDMVSKLKSELSKETFEIKISTNAQQIQQQLQQTVSRIGSSANAPIINMNGLNGIQKMKSNMANLTETIVLQREKVHKLWDEYKLAEKTFGKGTVQAQAAQASWKSAAESLLTLRTNAGLLGVDMKRVGIANAALKEQMKQNAQAAKQWNSDHMRLNATLAGGVHVSTQLGSALSSLFAVDAARQFLGQVIEIGGQLEKQRISMGAILGDAVKANHLFEQIKGLALKSPFGVVELDQYTKQLAAYGFRQNELFDMTKRLADISAGAGQDIGRLTLALGHVRSATYLTGITLRQFSMNNIPMLKMLAEYYTELEGKIVSTAEVQKRISKRQVSYQDVIEQIKRLTDEGGMFYNMQEKISESLAAKFKNLKDAVDIMYGEIAESSFGNFMKGAATDLTALTRHWKEVASMLSVAGAAFLLSKANIGLNTLAVQSNTAATMKQIIADKQLVAAKTRQASITRILTAEESARIITANRITVADLRNALAAGTLNKEEALRLITLKQIKIAQAMHLVGVNNITRAEIQAAVAANRWTVALKGVAVSLKNAFMGIGAGTWITIGAMVGMELYSAYSNWVDRIDSKAKEMQDVIKSRILDLQKQRKAIDGDNKQKSTPEMKARIDDMKQVLANSEAYTKTLNEQLKNTTDINKQYDILVGAIDASIDKNKRMLDYQEAIAEMIKASSGSHGFVEGLIWGDNGSPLRPLLNDDISKNMDQTLEAYKDLRTVIDNAWEYKDALKAVIDEMAKSGEIGKDFAERIKSAPFEEQIQILATSGYWDQIVTKIESTNSGFTKFADDIKEASQGVADKWKEIADDDIPNMLETERKRRNLSESEFKQWCLDNIDDFKMMLEGIADQLGVKEPEIRKRLKRLFYDYVRFGNLAKQLGGGERGEGMAAAMMAGAAPFSQEALEKLLGEDTLADLKEESSDADNGKKGKDSALETAKTKLQQYKAFLSEYKKYREQYSKEKTINLLETLFPDLKDEKGNFLGVRLVDDYIGVLDELRNSLKLTSEARKKFANEIDKTKADTMFDREKEALKKNADEMEDYIKRMEDQWKLYRSLLKKSGGNREFAELAFNESGRLWDEVSKQMLEQFNKRGQELGVVPMNFHWDMNEEELKAALVNADGQVQDELVKLAQKIQSIIKGNYKQFMEDSAEAYAKALTTSQKLLQVETELEDLRRNRNQYNGNDSAVIKGYDAQIKQKEKERQQLKIQQENEAADALQFYSAILSMTASEAETVGEKLRDSLVQQLKDGIITGEQYVKGIKKIDAQIDKIRDKKSFFEAFKSGGIEGVKKLKLEIADDELTNASNRLKEAEDRLKEAIEKNTKAIEGGDQNEIEQTENEVHIATQEKEGAEADHKIAKQNQKDAQKNHQSAKSFNQTLAGVAYAISAMVQAFNDAKQAAAAFGENLDANMNETGQYIMSFLEGANTALSRMQSGDFAGAISGFVFGSIASIAQKHDTTLKEDQKRSELVQKTFSNMMSLMEKKMESLMGTIDELEITNADRRNLYDYLGVIDPSIIKGLMTGNDLDAKELASRLFYHYKGNFSDIENPTETQKAAMKAIESGKYFDAAYANMLIQRDELMRQIADEEDMKDADEGKILDMKEELAEMEEDIKNFAKDMAEALYGIDFKSWANDLADALVSAWAAGENGAEAYKKKVSEILKDLGVKMITQRIIANTIKPIMDHFLDQFESDGGVLTEQGLAIIAEMYEAGEEMAQQTNAFMDGINEVAKQYGADLKDTSSSGSTGSSIKGITENTADLLASYINAIRADVSVDRNMIATYYPQFLTVITQVSVLSQTQVTLQQQIAANTLRNAEAADKIYDIMHKMEIGAVQIKMK